MRRFRVLVLVMLACGDEEALVRTQQFDPGADLGALLPCDVAQVFSHACASCHGSTPTDGAPLPLVTRLDLLAQAPTGGLVIERCIARMQDSAAPMPPPQTGHVALQADVAVLETWLHEGLPSGTCSVQPIIPGGGTGGGGGAGGGSAAGGMGGSGGTGGTGGSGGGTTATSMYCQPCSASTQCGGGGNRCIGFSFGNFCGTDCSQGQICGTNQRCATLTDPNTGTATGANCVPLSGSTCGGTGSGGGSGGGGGTAGSGGGLGGGSGGGTAACTTDTWSNWAASFFATNCASCHHHTGQFGTQSYVRSYLSSIRYEVSGGYMPPPSGLGSTTRTRLLKYLDCGVP